MISQQRRDKIKGGKRLSMKWDLEDGPIPYEPPSEGTAKNWGITPDEAKAIYDECIAELKLVEIEPGVWDWPPRKPKGDATP